MYNVSVCFDVESDDVGMRMLEFHVSGKPDKEAVKEHIYTILKETDSCVCHDDIEIIKVVTTKL